MSWRTRLGAFVALAIVSVSAHASVDGRRPGSVLVYPIHRSGTNFTILSVSNTALEPQGPGALGGGTNITWSYLNMVASSDPFFPRDCVMVERTEYLTPGDHSSILAGCQNAAGDQKLITPNSHV